MLAEIDSEELAEAIALFDICELLTIGSVSF
jgi:hypothetical protein